MKHMVKVTVIDKKLYPELQEKYCADPQAGACPCYNVGDTFIFRRGEEWDDFWHMGLDTLVKTSADPDTVAGGPKLPHCSELWDAISRYIYAGLQGGSIMRGWMKDERVMITCCSDGTRPVIFKIERLDYKAVYVDGIGCDMCRTRIKEALQQLDHVTDVVFRKEEGEAEYIELFLDREIPDALIEEAVRNAGEYRVVKIE
ncbi:MAG TPA: TIGR04076 family protein [Lachnospiraceae bacterium]|nr:TIGR04076 family protein [Lachnospiraceae bacterium]